MTLRSVAAGEALVIMIDRPPLNTLDLATIETLRKTFATLAANPPAINKESPHRRGYRLRARLVGRERHRQCRKQTETIETD